MKLATFCILLMALASCAKPRPIKPGTKLIPVYYRVKTVDKDGSVSYSTIVVTQEPAQ